MNTPTPLPFQLTEFPPERFQILELLGQGGMGKVFKARDRHLNRPVALKFILSQETPNLLIRLVLEAQYQASLDHPHIVKVYGVGTWEGRTCVMMQLIAGPSLDQIAPSLSISKRVELMVQAARGIHAAHLHGLIHRDLKPQNILVETLEGGSLHAFVMDFGLARATESESLTLSGAIMGSPHYMSPEQALGGRLVEARSDIYSLGATLYTAVVGAPPFSDSSDGKSTRLEFPAAEVDLSLPEPGRLLPVPRLGAHALSVLRRVLDEDPLPPRRLNPDVSMDLETIILRCLEKDPAHRYPSAAALADDLECYLEGIPISARRASWPRRVRTWARQNPTLSAVIAAGMCVGLLALGASGIAMRRLRQKAEIAARFEQAAQQNEIRFRMGTLSPQQNRASEVAKLLAQMEAKKIEARTIGPMASGPGAFFQGRALLILGRNREALKELQQAWEQGFRSPMAAQALGSALLEVYFEESQRLTGGRQQREANRQILAQKYLHPAIKHFQTGATLGERKNLYLAQVAFLEGRDDAALELASAELAITPWTIEAHRLRHLVYCRRAETAQDLATFEKHCQEAESHLQTLTDIARGDSRSHLIAAQWWIYKGGRLAFRFQVFQPELIQKGLDLATEASELDPTSAAPFALRAEAWGRMGDVLSLADRPASEIQKCNDQTLADADRALQLNPRSINAQLSKGFTKFLRTEAGMGKSGDLEEALAHVNQVIQIDDRVSEAYRLKSMIHDYQAEEAALKGEDGRDHLQAWVSTSQ
ncbi:MAG: protein kinase, partial [Holophaga sp.]|nr:protein kinase [Holophaga sp.]